MATIKIEQISGHLIGENAKHTLKLRLTITEEWVKGADRPSSRVLEDIEPLSLAGIKDGKYSLHYSFDGKEEEQPVKVSYGYMLAD